MGTPLFECLPEIYEAMVDWPRRLEREGPFFREIFGQAGVRRVLDVACGTGHHAAMFHRWGLEVEGADLSQAMIQRAIALHGQPPGLRWTVRPFQDPTPNPGYFDAAVCIGNSLALAGDKQTAAEAVRQMFRAVRPGGVVLIQVLNFWALPEGPLCWQKCFLDRISGQTYLILKGVHRAAGKGFVDLLLVELETQRREPPADMDSPTLPVRSRGTDHPLCGGRSDQPFGSRGFLPPTSTGPRVPEAVSQEEAALDRCLPKPLRWQTESEVFLGFSAEELEQMARQSGADRVVFYGGYQSQPYHSATSQDMIMAAWRKGCSA